MAVRGVRGKASDPMREQYIIEQIATRRLVDIAAELGVSRQRIDRILKSHGIRLREDTERNAKFMEQTVLKNKAIKAARPKYERKRPWWYPVIRKLANAVNVVGITSVAKLHGINPDTLRRGFKIAGFDVNGGPYHFMKVYPPSQKTEIELQMEKGLGPQIRKKVRDEQA